jgi:nucleotide-binding universal stress UspA family protein
MKILVPLDGSPFSEAILPRVAAIAAPLGATVELLTVASPSEAQQTPLTYAYHDTIPAAAATGTKLGIPLLDKVIPPPAESREQAVERLEAEWRDYLAMRVPALQGIDTAVHVVVGDDPAEAIIAHVRQEGADLIAMATHARSSFKRLFAGSVAAQIIRSGVAPVLVLRPRRERQPIPAG